MSRNHPRLDIETFDHHLITTGYLDPIYMALVRAEQAKALRLSDFKKSVEPTPPEEDGGERKIIPITQID